MNGSTVFDVFDRFIVIARILTFYFKVARNSAALSSHVLSRKALIQKRRRFEKIYTRTRSLCLGQKGSKAGKDR